MKKCNHCHEDKPLTDFYKNKRNYDGFANQCKKCAKSFNSQYYKNNTEKFKKSRDKNIKLAMTRYNEYKKTLQCSHCPENDPCCLEFHHPDSNKEFNISDKKRHLSWIRLKTEIDKCIVLCRNCHAKEHKRLLTAPLAQR